MQAPVDSWELIRGLAALLFIGESTAMNSVTRVSFAVCLGLSVAALILAMQEMSVPTLLLAAVFLFLSAMHGWHKAH
jgi:hypothetical protein